ncbi:MAG: NUDIX hydrolase [Candidatus Omnitrophica bacterium]|nr:NUDIX hydrolase [Candidatus Omnitrophota bacterium]
MNPQQNKKAKKVILKDGRHIRFVKKGYWEYIERKNCSAIVIILAMTDKKEVIFVEQYRPPVDKNVIEFPAGLVNDGKSRKKETLIEGARRELLEETGYKAGRMIKVLHGPAASGISSDMLTVVVAYDLKKVGSGGGDELESIKVHTVLFDCVEDWMEEMRKKGRLVSPRIYAGLYLLKKYNKTIIN